MYTTQPWSMLPGWTLKDPKSLYDSTGTMTLDCLVPFPPSWLEPRLPGPHLTFTGRPQGHSLLLPTGGQSLEGKGSKLGKGTRHHHHHHHHTDS